MKEGKIKFNTVFVSDTVPSDPNLGQLKKWSEQFQKNGLTPEVEGNYTGNLSFRLNEGFVITASALKNKENLGDDSFVTVKKYDQQTNTFYVEGKKKPSSESIMHQLIYDSNMEIMAVFHGHNYLIVRFAKEIKLPVTENEYESGTVELAKEVLKILGDNKVVVLKNHGFVCVAKNMKTAGELALATLEKAKIERAREQSGICC